MFNVGDIRALRLLAIAMGAVLIGFAIVGRGDQRMMLTAIALVFTMIGSSLAMIYVLRRWAQRKSESSGAPKPPAASVD